MVTLYKKDSKSNIREWSIWSENNIIFMEYGSLGGELILNSEAVDEGLQSRTLSQQINSRINSRINKQKDKGYVEEIDKAKENKMVNGLGYPLPAKCTAYNGSNGIFKAEGLTAIQHKLNGHHANITNDNGKLVMYSNGGKIIESFPEVLEGLEIPIGSTIEGELYHHGTVLQTISSWVRRRQEQTLLLKYCIYDINHPTDYNLRYDFLKKLKINNYCEILETDFFNGEIDLEPLLKKSVELGFEGKILRLSGFGHESGKRGKGLIKVKPRHFKKFRVDDEFLVVDIKLSKKGICVLHCVTDLGKSFKVTCHGSADYKSQVYEEKELHIGKHVRAEFESYTKSKTPFQPIALEWREKSEE
jgi:hypothetical protein